MSTWRERMRPSIARVLAECAGRPEPEIRRALREEWDRHGMYERRGFAYRAYLAEISSQMGKEAPRVPKKASQEVTEDDIRRQETSRILRVAKRGKRWPGLAEPEPPRPPLEPAHPELPLFSEEEAEPPPR
jgi:hypothetical protein